VQEKFGRIDSENAFYVGELHFDTAARLRLFKKVLETEKSSSVNDSDQ
jgi:hypothetical protein